MSDSEIEQWVLRQLEFVGLPDCREVCVFSRKGIVTLDGTVPNRMSKLAMQKAARGARGVRAIVNQLQATESSLPRASSAKSASVLRGLRPAPPATRRPARAISTY